MDETLYTISEYNKALGKRIRELRKSRYFSQEELAIKLQLAGCDFSRSTVSKIEIGMRRVFANEVKPIANALGTSCDALLDF